MPVLSRPTRDAVPSVEPRTDSHLRTPSPATPSFDLHSLTKLWRLGYENSHRQHADRNLLARRPGISGRQSAPRPIKLIAGRLGSILHICFDRPLERIREPLDANPACFACLRPFVTCQGSARAMHREGYSRAESPAPRHPLLDLRFGLISVSHCHCRRCNAGRHLSLIHI